MSNIYSIIQEMEYGGRLQTSNQSLNDLIKMLGGNAEIDHTHNGLNINLYISALILRNMNEHNHSKE